MIHSLTLTALTHSLFRWEWMGKKRTEKVECHPATVSKGLNSAHHFLVIPKHFRIAFSPHLLFPPSHTLFCPSPLFPLLWPCWGMWAGKRNVRSSSWNIWDSFCSKNSEWDTFSSHPFKHYPQTVVLWEKVRPLLDFPTYFLIKSDKSIRSGSP